MGYLLDKLNSQNKPTPPPITAQPAKKPSGNHTLLGLINKYGEKVQKIGETVTSPIFDIAKTAVETEETGRKLVEGIGVVKKYNELKKAGKDAEASSVLKKYNESIKKGVNIPGLSKKAIRPLDTPGRAIGAGQVIGSLVAPQGKVLGSGTELVKQALIKRGVPSALYFGGAAMENEQKPADIAKQYALGLGVGTVAGVLPNILKTKGTKTPEIGDFKTAAKDTAIIDKFKTQENVKTGIQSTFDDYKMMQKTIASDPDMAKVYAGKLTQPGTEYLTPELAAGRARDIATKLEAYKTGLGDKYVKDINLYRSTPETLVSRAENLADGYAPEISSVAKTSAERLVDALNKLPEIRSEQTIMNVAERAKRFAAAQRAGSQLTGEAGFAAEKSALAGEFPKIQFESLRKSFSEKDVTNFLEEIKNSTSLSYGETLSARNGFLKLFGQAGGQVPQPGELRLLEKVFGNKFVESVMKKRPLIERFGTKLAELANFPKSAMATGDLSAPLRQGIGLIGRKEWWKSFASMFKYFGSEKAYQGLRQDLVTNKYFPLAEEGRLSFTDVNAILGGREEAIMSPLTERIPGLGKISRASNRAYTGFLNKLRMDTFSSFMKTAEKMGRNPWKDIKLVEDSARFINLATGRGSLGALEKAAVALNSAFFSPRLVASRLQILNPVEYIKYDPLVRKEAIKALLGFGTIALTATQLARLGGAKVGSDPTSADFGKIKTGNTRYDILGGFQQPIRLAAQLLAGKVTSTTTGKAITLGKKGDYKPLTRKDIIYRYFEGKESPTASFITQWLQGTDWKGQPFNVPNEILTRLYPIAIQDVSDALREYGASGFLRTIPTFFGVGTQTYLPIKKK